MRLQTRGRLAGLTKYVPFWLVVLSHSLTKLQQVPKPLAQVPSLVPPLERHSEEV